MQALGYSHRSLSMEHKPQFRNSNATARGGMAAIGQIISYAVLPLLPTSVFRAYKADAETLFPITFISLIGRREVTKWPNCAIPMLTADGAKGSVPHTDSRANNASLR